MTYTLDYSLLLSEAVLNCKIHFELTDERILQDKEWASETIKSLDFRSQLLKEISDIEFDHPLKEDMEDDIFLQLDLLEFYLQEIDHVLETAEKEMEVVDSVVQNELRTVEYLHWKNSGLNMFSSIRNLSRFAGIPILILAFSLPILLLVVSYFQR